jgi:uncharacterized YccA/Bax inhibitor family protein
MMRSTNYVFRKAEDLTNTEYENATFAGVGIKTGILLTVALVTGLFAMANIEIFLGNFGVFIFIALATFVLSMIISFSPRSARYLSLPYAVLEGSLTGAVTGLYEYQYSGIAMTALLMTIAIFLAGAVLYFTGVIKAGPFFRKFLFTALLGTLIGSLLIFVVSIFKPSVIEIFYGATSNIALLFSVIMVVLAGLYVIISLDNVTRIVDSGLGKSYEWYASFGILLNVIWLYLEVLRLLYYLFGRRR